MGSKVYVINAVRRISLHIKDSSWALGCSPENACL